MGNLIRSLFSASDEQAMWRVKMQNDAQAFARLVERWQQPIQNLCHRMIGDPHRSQDLSQDVFARVFNRRADWQPTARFSTFLWRIALNLCHDELRKRRRRGECSLEAWVEDGLMETEPLAADALTPDNMAESNERGEQVRRAMLKLAPIYREVVALRHYEGLKFCEIGEVLGVPQGTVKSRMAEALTQLGKLLKHLEEDTICNRKNHTPELKAL